MGHTLGDTDMMTKQDFLARMANAYDMGLCKPEVLKLAERWTDGVMRLEGGQFHYWHELMEAEFERLERFASHKVLANDVVGYKVIQLMAVLTHPCQKCAVSPDAWHTRTAFCDHRNKK